MLIPPTREDNAEPQEFGRETTNRALSWRYRESCRHLTAIGLEATGISSELALGPEVVGLLWPFLAMKFCAALKELPWV